MKLNKIFTSHMVFAKGKPIRIYGEGTGVVKIIFASEEKTVVSENGKWLVEFDAMEYGGPYTLTAVFEETSVILEDIYIGEVYLFAGQSNMQFKMAQTLLDINSFESNDMLRLYSTDRIEDTDFFKAKDGWVLCRKEEIKYWSALTFLCGNEISKSKDIAVGIIVCYQGASVIESWVPKGVFEKIGINIPAEKRYLDHTHEIYGRWNGDGVLYSYALSQVIPYSLSAVVWYQGESDISLDEAKVYRQELCEMIRVWRKSFNDPNLFFAVVQIADCLGKEKEPWSLIQKAQADVPKVMENVVVVVSKDVCENNNIHPKTKDKLAKRIAEALA